MKRWLPHIGIVLGVLIAVYAVFFSSSDEDQIRAKLNSLEDAVALSDGDSNIVIRGAHVRKAFADIFIKMVTYQIPELRSEGAGRTGLAGLAATAPRLYRSVRIDFGDLDIRVDDAKISAVAYGEALLTGKRHSGQLQRDTRTVSFRFDKIEGDWLIVSLTASAGKGVNIGSR